MDPITDSIHDSASRGGYAAIAAIAIWAIIALVKRDDIPIPLPPRARPLLALALGQVYAVLEAVVGGMPWGAAVVRGLVVAAGAIATHEVGSKLRAPEVVKPPSVPPPMPPLLLLVFLAGCVPLLGCGSPLEQAVQVQHAGAAAIEHGGEELQERCTDRLVPLADLPTLAERQAAAAPIREVCDPARMAYGSARAAHVLLSATLAALAGGVTVGELVDLTSQTARALADLAATFARLRGEP